MSVNSEERTVYVKNLDEKVDKALIEELFTQMGPVVSVFVKEHKQLPTSEQLPQQHGSKFAFVEFQDEESVLFAIEMLDEIMLFGKKIIVSPRSNTKQQEVYWALRDKLRESRPSQTPVLLSRDRSPDRHQDYLLREIRSMPTPVLHTENRHPVPLFRVPRLSQTPVLHSRDHVYRNLHQGREMRFDERTHLEKRRR